MHESAHRQENRLIENLEFKHRTMVDTPAVRESRNASNTVGREESMIIQPSSAGLTGACATRGVIVEATWACREFRGKRRPIRVKPGSARSREPE